MENIQGTRAQTLRVNAAQLHGTVEGLAPEKVDDPEAPDLDIFREFRLCGLGAVSGSSAAEYSELDGVHELDVTVSCDVQSSARPTAPGGESARALFVEVRRPQRAGIDVDAISGRHDFLRRELGCLPRT